MKYKAVCPFLDECPAYAHGVELGMLFSRMQRRKIIAGIFTRSNQDQILLLASRLGWTVVKMKTWRRDWVWIKMRRKDHGQ